LTEGDPTTLGVCIVCRGDVTLFGPYSHYTYGCCQGCGTIQLSPMPDENEMARAYQMEYVANTPTKESVSPDLWRKVSEPYCSSLVQALLDHRVDGPVVDFGAGWGVLLEMLIEHGFTARGVELSLEKAAYAQKRGLPLQQGDLHALQGLDGRVSAITLLAVFEHLVNHAAVLSAAHTLLRDGGLFVTLHPTATAYRLIGTIVRLGNRRKPLPDLAGAFTAPWHTALFSIKGTEDIISRHGFRLLEIRRAPQGRLGGLLGLVQRGLELVNTMGWWLLGTRWPLVTTHIFVFQKIGASEQEGRVQPPRETASPTPVDP
jgi:2-polyprenyl-3-methyl-5-hydroxy-6-metoxy-1,4-benzoquinol methylase